MNEIVWNDVVYGAVAFFYFSICLNRAFTLYIVRYLFFLPFRCRAYAIAQFNRALGNPHLEYFFFFVWLIVVDLAICFLHFAHFAYICADSHVYSIWMWRKWEWKRVVSCLSYVRDCAHTYAAWNLGQSGERNAFCHIFFNFFFFFCLLSGHHVKQPMQIFLNRLSFDQRCHIRIGKCTDVYCALPLWTQITRTNHTK